MFYRRFRKGYYCLLKQCLLAHPNTQSTQMFSIDCIFTSVEADQNGCIYTAFSNHFVFKWYHCRFRCECLLFYSQIHGCRVDERHKRKEMIAFSFERICAI